MKLGNQKGVIQNWIAQNYGVIIIVFLSLLTQLVVSYFQNWIAFLIWSLLIANTWFLFLVIKQKIDKENSKLVIWLKINITAILFSFVVMGFSFLFVYGVASIPDNILPVLWIGAFITVAWILLFRLHRLVKKTE